MKQLEWEWHKCDRQEEVGEAIIACPPAIKQYEVVEPNLKKQWYMVLAEYPPTNTGTPIDYCPFCGKKLKLDA